MTTATKPTAIPAQTVTSSLDDELRSAVRRVMISVDVLDGDVAKVQEILDRKAFQIRAPFFEKVRRAKEAG